MTVTRKNSPFDGAKGSGKTESVVGGRQQVTPRLPTFAGRDRWPRTTSTGLSRVLIAGAMLAICVLASRPAGAVDAKKIFNQRCTACHTFGKGVKVGPDLKGVTARRQRPWLLKFVRSSQKVIASGDPVATELFRTFKRQRMPDWTDLTPEDVGTIM